MIIECPACATRYEVPDAAIGSQGRKVRCAKCRHSWQAFDISEVDPVDPVDPADADLALAAEEIDEEAGARVDGASAGTVAEPQDTLVEPSAVAPAAVPERSGLAFAPMSAGTPALRPRRRGFWVWAVAILVVMIGAAFAAMFFWGRPAWVPGSGAAFSAEAPEHLVLDFPREQQGPRQLPNGTEIFGARGTVTNAGATVRRVPEILIVLRDSHQRIVYSWEVSPPKRSLAPGETVAINEAVTDAPRSAQFADIGWKPG